MRRLVWGGFAARSSSIKERGETSPGNLTKSRPTSLTSPRKAGPVPHVLAERTTDTWSSAN